MPSVKVAPSIEGLGERSYLAGRLSNDESNLSTWLMHPHHIEPGVAMPEMGVTRMTQDSSPHFWSAATKMLSKAHAVQNADTLILSPSTSSRLGTELQISHFEHLNLLKRCTTSGGDDAHEP